MKTNLKRILITGANGFVGKYLVSELKSHNYYVIGVDVQNDSATKVDEYRKVDIRNSCEVEQLISNISPDGIIHLAAQSDPVVSWIIPQETFLLNVNGGINILDAVRRQSKRIKCLFVGSSTIYSDSNDKLSELSPVSYSSPYSVSKLSLEQICLLYNKKYNMDIVVTRSFNHVGVGQKENAAIPSFCKQIIDFENGIIHEVKVGNIDVSRDFTNVNDIVRAYRMLLETDNTCGIYNVGSGVAISLRIVLQTLCSFSKTKIKIVEDKERLRINDNSYVCCDNTKIRETTGWHPLITINASLKEMYEWYKGEKQ